MNKPMTNAKFKRIDWKDDKLLICPDCIETLARVDIEHYAKCPYCNCPIVIDSEMEDYILKPVVDKWIFFQNVLPRSFKSLDL